MATKTMLHLLDVGGKIYGDSILVTSGDRTILIDGAHPGDSELIKGQLADILGGDGPFDIDLLIVTHCHADHIGCLPDLIGSGVLNVKKALVADEELGLGAGGQDSGADMLGDQLFAAMREEPLLSDRPEDVQAFLADAAKLESNYRAMLAKLGNKAIRYKGQSLAQLQNAFQEFGLEILGPTKQHLQLCADELERLRGESRRRARSRPSGGDDASALAALYRDFRAQVSDSIGAADMVGAGAALNDQSIVIKMTLNGTPVLLTGDQQLAKAEVPGLNDLMQALRQEVVDAGPYPVMKAAHHGSYNGVDADLIDSCQSGALLFSGGFNDPGHPSGNVLALMKQRKDSLTWLRTDKNGRIDVKFLANGPSIEFERGQANDFRPNPKPGDLAPAEPPSPPAARAVVPAVKVEPSVDGYVEVSASAKLPPDVDSLQVTFEIRRSGREGRRRTGPKDVPSSETKEEPEPQPAVIADSVRRRNLLFVTNQPALEKNAGGAAKTALDMIRSAGRDVLLLTSQRSPWLAVQEKLRSKTYEGVVLLGGYDVVPPARMDCLGQLRGSLKPEDIANDQDAFVVWSDDVYGDLEGDQDPETPVSRIAEGSNGRLLLKCLSAAPAGQPSLWGLRNLNRPFADAIQAARPRAVRLKTSGPLLDTQIPPDEPPAGSLYFMLHGADYDTSEFWGEQGGTLTSAFSIRNVPAAISGCVFAGCCYGALIAQLPAARVRPGEVSPSREVGQSIALSFLQAGALAFVGCTGTHYSPMEPPFASLGGPMHRAFFERYDGGEPPAKALLQAKQAYAREFPHGLDLAAGQAVELKILRQFTCLGLGW